MRGWRFGAAKTCWHRLRGRVPDLLLRCGVALPLVALWLMGLLDTTPPPWGRLVDLLLLLSSTVVVGLALALLAPQVTRTATMAGGLLAASASIATSVVLGLRNDASSVFGLPGESLGLTVVLIAVVYRCRPLPAVATAALCGAAFAAEGIRVAGEIYGFRPVLPFLFALAVGLYLRLRAAQRRNHAEQVRRRERLAMARDLHDTVAHHVTGIAVQVQALQHARDLPVETVRAALPEIEDAATQTLASTRWLVSTLREPDDAPLRVANPVTKLQELKHPGEGDHPRVEVELHIAVSELPAEISTAVVSIAQEAVTNAVRHAGHASLVRVRVSAHSGTVELEVDDDGAGGGSLFDHGYGYGLVGMEERAKLLGGELTAGPAHQHRGWRVSAQLPLRETPAAVPTTGQETQ